MSLRWTAPLLVLWPLAAAAMDGPQPTLPIKTLTIVTKSGAHHDFAVEMATTPEEQEIGEMFRTNIPADHGMFFDWGTPRPVPMWMKNCPVPEDMVFIGSDGTITHIAENTVPESLANISSGGTVRATLELRGGITAQLDISVGDKVTVKGSSLFEGPKLFDHQVRGSPTKVFCTFFAKK